MSNKSVEYNHDIEVQESKWELVDEAPGATTERLKINGGYLYHVGNKHCRTASMVFVPEHECRYHGERMLYVCATCYRQENSRVQNV